jgi:hypothetical protein
MDTQVAQLIVQMVSPAVMVSACGLLLLGLGNRYARVVDRIRAFAAEVRQLQGVDTGASPVDAERLRVLNVQISDLFRRGRLVRAGIPTSLPVALFCAGMGCVLAMAIYAWRETMLSFRLLRLEAPQSAS